VTVLDRFLADGGERFQAWAQEEAEELAKGAFGPTMLEEVGHAYVNAAEEYMGTHHSTVLGVDGLRAKIVRQGNSMMVSEVGGQACRPCSGVPLMGCLRVCACTREQKSAALAGAAINAFKAAKGMSNAMPKEEGEVKPEDQAKAQEAMQEGLPHFLNAMSKMSAYDINKTVIKICTKVLKDSSVSALVRKRRAEGLLLLGGVFRRTAAVAMSSSERDAKQQIEEAMQKTMATLNGQEL
jgi:hypothetical protein